MGICYKKLWKLLIDKDMKKKDLAKCFACKLVKLLGINMAIYERGEGYIKSHE